jgi:hypothetical protein
MNGRVLVLGLLMFVIPCAVWAQSTAQINGAVKDQSGAILPGVEVMATHIDTGLARMTVTNETGTYVLTSLPVGPYRLDATLAGFRTHVQRGIVLQVNSNPEINIVLEVGQVTEQIEVQANAALVETRNTGVGQVIDNARVLELPLNGRQVTELVLLSGLATAGADGTLNPGSRNYPTTVISVAGGQTNGLAYNLDGGNHNDPYNNLNLPMPFPDALQEFKVETSGLQAQYGGHSAGAVNAVTKSGTNDFHGDLFEFLRNGSLNARNAAALTNDGLKRNQFGGTIGGPVVQNKLFFFAGTQATTQRSTPTDNRAFIPTAAMLDGDFTTVSSAACNTRGAVTLKAPFVDNKVDPSLFSPAALNLVTNKLFPTTTDPCGEVRFGRRSKVDEYITVGRVDYQASEKHSLFGRYMEARRNQATNFDGTNILSLSDGIQPQRVYSFVLGDTYLIGTGTVSSFRGTLNRTKNPKDPPQFFDLTDLGVKGVYESVPHYSFIIVTNGFTVSSALVNPGRYNSTSFQLNEDLSVVRGSHQIAIGGNFMHEIFNGNSGINRNAQITFAGQILGSGLADFLLGRLSGFQQGNALVSYSRENFAGVYIQDTWKANSRMTVSAGIRWEPFIAAYSGIGKTEHFDREAFDKGIHSSVYANAPAGLLFPGDPGIPSQKYTNNHLKHFAPRVGLALDPTGSGKMTIRAAYGLAYDFPAMWAYHGSTTGAPYGTVVTLANPVGGFDNPWQGYPGGNPFPSTPNRNSIFPTTVAYINYPADMKIPYVHQWNLSVQKQVGTDWLVSANYIGNSTLHIAGALESNPVIYLPGANCTINGVTYTPCSSTSNTNQRRQLYLQNPTEGRYYGPIISVDDGGTGNYNGLLLSVQRRQSHGLTVQGNYTWSHCISDTFVAMGGQVTAGIYPGRRRNERANCGAGGTSSGGDLRQIVNLSTVYETPQFSNETVRQLAGRWQISGIVRLQTGNYLTVTSGFDTALTNATGNNRANQVLPDAYAANRNSNQWLNPAAFSRPADGQWGNSSKNILGPGVIRIDMALSRTFQIREKQSVQFRAEAFNLPNHMNPGTPVTALNNPNFGKILTAGDPRILQLALKYLF